MPRSPKNPSSRFRPLAQSRGRVFARRSPEDSPALQAMWDVVARVPLGRVASYGEIARAAGYPGRARQAGFALRHLPEGSNLPWHRIVGAGGRIAFPKGTRHFREQVRLLRGEGVEVTDGRAATSALLAGEEF